MLKLGYSLSIAAFVLLFGCVEDPPPVGTPDAGEVDAGEVDGGPRIPPDDGGVNPDGGPDVDGGPDATLDSGALPDAEVPPPLATGLLTEFPQDERCSIHSAWPPRTTYKAPVRVAGEWLAPTDDMVIRQRDGGWINTGIPTPTEMRPYQDGAVRTDEDGVYLLRDGGWETLSSVPSRRISVHGDHLYVVQDDGIGHYDGATFETIPNPAHAVNSAFGDGAIVYALSEISSALSRWDGSEWTLTPWPVRLGAPTDGATLADGQIYVLGVLGLARATASGFVSEAGPTCPAGTARFYRLMGAGRHLLIYGRCGTGARVLLRVDGGAWQVLPSSTAAGDIRDAYVTESGQAVAGGYDGRLQVFEAGAWHPIELGGSPGLSDTVHFTGRSADEIYIATSEALVHFDGTRWAVFPGTETWDVGTAWQAPSGMLFVTTRDEDGTIHFRRFDGSEWTLDHTWSAYPCIHRNCVTKMLGRSETDAVIGIGPQVLFWDGATWSGETICQDFGSLGYQNVVAAVPAGSNNTYAKCLSATESSMRAGFHDGSEWSGLATVDANNDYNYYPMGPTEAPFAVRTGMDDRLETYTDGESALPVLVPNDAQWYFFYDSSHVFASDRRTGGFAFSDGSAEWLVEVELDGREPYSPDGRTVFGLAEHAGRDSVTVCDMAP